MGDCVGLAPLSGCGELTEAVAVGHVGLVLALEVSRLARSNSDWYRLLDLTGITDTLIGDADGLHHSVRPSCSTPGVMLGF